MDKLIKELQEIKILEKLQERMTDLKDINNSLYGQLEETEDEIIVYDLAGSPKGKYVKSDDTTYTMNGAIIGYGNTVINCLSQNY